MKIANHRLLLRSWQALLSRRLMRMWMTPQTDFHFCSLARESKAAMQAGRIAVKASRLHLPHGVTERRAQTEGSRALQD